MSTSAQKMIKARANLVMGHPFFGTLALRMKMEPDEQVKGGAVTDGVVIRYNPEIVDKLPLSKVQGLIAATVMHPALLHHTRRGHRDLNKWNTAADYATHSMLVKAGFDLPDEAKINAAYEGMTPEQIYPMLPDEPGDGGGDGGGGGGGGNNNGGVQDSPNSQNKGSSAGQQANEEAEWKVALAQAAHVAKQQGKLPADIERMIETTLEAVMPWKALLHRFATEKCNDDFSWSRGNRRFVAQGLYLPSRQSQDCIDTIVVAIDTSGSIGQKELDEFGGEVTGIHGELRPKRLIVIYCDSRINHIDTFGPDDEVTFKLHGGGGTDFRPPFAYLDEQQITPKCFVYLTDGYGSFPDQEPHFPTLWCINNAQVVPPHGEHLVVEF